VKIFNTGKREGCSLKNWENLGSGLNLGAGALTKSQISKGSNIKEVQIV